MSYIQKFLGLSLEFHFLGIGNLGLAGYGWGYWGLFLFGLGFKDYLFLVFGGKVSEVVLEWLMVCWDLKSWELPFDRVCP